MDFDALFQPSSFRSLSRSIRHPSLPGSRPFKSGDIIKGTVIRQYPRNEVLVGVKGRTFIAHSKLNLIEGNRYHFMVHHRGSRTELRVMNDTVQRPGFAGSAHSSATADDTKLAHLLSWLFKTGNMKGLSLQSKQALKTLQRLFPAIVYSDKGDHSGPWFSRFIAASGLLWENKVLKYLLKEKAGSWKRLVASDLKGQLLSLEKSLNVEDNSLKHIARMADKVKQTIFLVEQDQFQNLPGIRENPGWLIHVPGFIEDGFIEAELFFKKKENEEGFHFSILLEFSRLGQIEFDVSIIDSVMGIKILTEDEEKAGLIAENQHVLIEGLRNLGIKTGAIHCEVRETHRHPENEQYTNVHLII